MSVGRICAREVHLAERGESVVEAARRMRGRGVGTLVVDGAGRPVGLVTRLVGIVGLDDVLPMLAEELVPIGDPLERQMPGPAPHVPEER